jgi:transcriptional regulator with XRE-family HTH domain
MTQLDLADALEERLGRPWDVTKVSKLENGHRGVDVELLMALRDIFGLPLEWWVDGPTSPSGRDLATPPILNRADEPDLESAQEAA